MEENWEIAKAGADDAAAIAHILVKSWQVAYRGIMPDKLLDNLSIKQREDGWRYHLNSGGEAYLLRSPSAATGIVEVSDFRDAIPNYSDCGEIPVIYLLPEYYGSGLGGKLMQFALALLAQRGRENVGIWVLEENARAIGFYQKHGFVRSAHSKVHGPTGLVEILMLRQAIDSV
jgi:ribosomal protein S18 acetylase RimI-like enzyme